MTDDPMRGEDGEAVRACQTCAHFQPCATDAEPDTMGECRRYAPRPFQHQREDDYPSWPPVFPCEWCGEYQRQEPTR